MNPDRPGDSASEPYPLERLFGAALSPLERFLRQATAGGMVMPALIYLSLNPEGPAARGWGVPMATDIAFAIGILVLLASRIPRALIVFLMALAIADDLGAVLVIALFYTADIDQAALLDAAISLGVLILLNRGGVRARLPYWLVGLALWYFTALSGIHATVAGVLLAFTLPVRPKHTAIEFEARVTQLLASFRRHAADPATPSDTMRSHDMATIAASLERDAQAVQSPLQRTEHGLSASVTFLVLPVFALANAGVDFRGADLLNSINQPITLGITLGLVIGKFIGIGVFSWLAVKSGIARLPAQVRWPHLLGAAWLGGIGFTMSLFIAQLGFTEPEQLEQAKVGILFGSLVAATLGLASLLACTGKEPQKP